MSTETAAVRRAAAEDAAACAEILAPYILNTAVNMHGEPLSEKYFAGLIARPRPFFVAAAGKEICGYAYSDMWNGRCGYSRTVEVSVYVKCGRGGGGIGGRLLGALLDSLRAEKTLAAVALIALPNAPSVRLHEKFGFAKIGVMPGVGWKFGRPHDIGIWVLNFS